MLFGLFTRRNIHNLTDLELLELVKDNNRHAIGELFQRYSPLVMGLCLKYMKNVAKAEDLMMEIFEKLSSKIKKSDIDNFKNWLYSVSRNECLMELRKRKLDTTNFEKSAFFIEGDDGKSLQEKIEKEIEFNKLEEAIQSLKKEQRECIELFYLKKMSYQEIEKSTSYSLKKVKSHIQNGKRNLKIILEKE